MELCSAAERGDTEELRRALAAGAEVDARDPRTGRTALMAAAASPRADSAALRLLLAHGADVNARSWTPETAPEAAAELAAPDSRQYVWNGVTPLLLAASTGDVERVELLLDAGADLAATTTHGYDALINAAFSSPDPARSSAPLVALLLARGADPNRRTSFGESALQTASGFAQFAAVRLLLEAGADAGRLRWSPLMQAVVFRGLEEVHAALAGAELEARDSAGRTALHLAVQLGDLGKVQALRAAGAALATGPGGRSPLWYAMQPDHPELLAWLLAEGCDPNALNDVGETPLMDAARSGSEGAVRLLLAAGAEVDWIGQFDDDALGLAENPQIVRLLLAAGADINQVNDTMRKALFGLPAEAPLDLPRERYLAGKTRRYGRGNPAVMREPFWQAMIRSRVSAYTARSAFGDTGSYGEPVWCFERFGRTLTALPDGRFVEIAGEHEDAYDPDFCIYNDVVVYDGSGGFTIYGYPAELFPPTDFHTATLVGNTIYLIGSLGYRGQRRIGETQLFRLSCVTWAMERLHPGGRSPGWISRHSARYEPEARRIVVSGGKRCALEDGVEQYRDNAETFVLDLATLAWVDGQGAS